MADAGLFIGWGEVARGREAKSLEVFQEAMAYYAGLEQNGTVESVEAVFLEPHGGDLQGFFLIKGERQKLAALRVDQDFVRMSARAALVVDGIGVVGASLGDAVPEQVSMFQEVIADLA